MVKHFPVPFLRGSEVEQQIGDLRVAIGDDVEQAGEALATAGLDQGAAA